MGRDNAFQWMELLVSHTLPKGIGKCYRKLFGSKDTTERLTIQVLIFLEP